MDTWVDFPSAACFQELISSFPQEWRGLFAALNVAESQAVPLGTKWLRDRAYSPRKGHISPHWPDLMRALTLSFPVVFNAEVSFRPKFACLTLNLQRNLLSFIVFHSESIPKDDIEVFLAMLSKLPQRNSCTWFKVLTNVLQTKVNRTRLETEQTPEGLEDTRECTNPKIQNHSVEWLESLAKDTEIPDWAVSMNTSIPRLENLCTSLRRVNFPGSSLLASNIRLTGSCSDCKDDGADTNLNEQTLPVIPEEMDTDMHVETKKDFLDDKEVIEIPDDIPKTSFDTRLFELPAPPDLSNQPDITEMVAMEEVIPVSNCLPDKVIHFKEYLKSSEEFERKCFQEFVSIFSGPVPKDLDRICQFMEMDKVPETATIILIEQFLSLNMECSFQSTVVFADYCIKLKLQTLEQAASRNLLAAVQAFAKAHPKPFVDGMMIKMFQSKSMQWPQCDIILKLIRDSLERDILKYFLGNVLMTFEQSPSRLIWNDNIISIFAAVVDMKLDLDNCIFGKFVAALQSQSLALASNLKFTKLLLTTINKYGPMVKQSHSAIQQMLGENNTFLKKSALAALKKVSR